MVHQRGAIRHEASKLRQCLDVAHLLRYPVSLMEEWVRASCAATAKGVRRGQNVETLACLDEVGGYRDSQHVR